MDIWRFWLGFNELLFIAHHPKQAQLSDDAPTETPIGIPHSKGEISTRNGHFDDSRFTTWRIIPVSKWLIIMVSKSPKRGYSLYKWPFHGL